MSTESGVAAGRYSAGVPSAEKTSRATGRCSVHSGSPAVASCDECGRPVCIACAVPVRGGVVGPECLGRVLGPDAPGDPDLHPVRPARLPLPAVGGGFLAAFLASAMPWTNAVTSSHIRGFFGSFELSPVSWALVTAVASVAGLLGWVALALRPALVRPGVLVLMAALAVAGTAGAVLFVAFPPFATHPWLGPWVALPASAFAAGASLAAARTAAGRSVAR